MLLDGYSFRLVNISCLPSSTSLNALVELDQDISAVLPYLNALFEGGHYAHEEQIFDFMRDGHIVTLLPRQMKVTGVDDNREAREFLDWLKDEINRIWTARHEIEPLFEAKVRQSPLDVLRLLPRTNCGECGVPTCLAFAIQVIRGASAIDECPRYDAAGAH